MEEVKISVIVPVYNTEKYLVECINSLINQTYKNLEIILINDGSTDKSLEIIEDFAKIDKRIKIINQENKGFYFARNEGLKHATGDWIGFLDSDDWLKNDCFEKFSVALNTQDSFEIYMFNAVSFEEKENINDMEFYEFFNKNLWSGKNNQICTYKDCQNPFQGNLAVYNKIYKSEFLKENNFKFEKGFAEDERFWLEALFKAKSIYITDEIFYHYRQRKDSVIHTINDKAFEIFETYEKIKKVLVENKIYDLAKYAFLQYKFRQFSWCYFECSNEIKSKFYKKAKDDLLKELKTGFSLKIINKLKYSELFFSLINLEENEFYSRFKPKKTKNST